MKKDSQSPVVGPVSAARRRILAIEFSLRTWVLGICALLPVIGLTPGVMALFYYFRVQSRFGGEWNPASRYLAAGAILAALGVVNSFIAVITVALIVISKQS